MIGLITDEKLNKIWLMLKRMDTLITLECTKKRSTMIGVQHIKKAMTTTTWTKVKYYKYNQ